MATRPDGDGLWPTRALPIAEGDRWTLQRLLSLGRDDAGRRYLLGREDDRVVYELRPGG